jgi:hypothetical protein
VTIEDFLQEWVDGYLIGDLKTLEDVRLPAGQKYGAVGYPLVASVAAGIELLGALLCGQPFTPHNADRRFNYYWDTYLTKIDAVYAVLEQRKLVRKLCRDGIAHLFLAKPGVKISKDGAQPAIAIDSDRTSAKVDALSLARDFRRSYDELVRPLVFDPARRDRTTVSTMQTALTDILQQTENESQEIFKTAPSSALLTTSTRIFATPTAALAAAPMTGAMPMTRSGGHPPKKT